MNQSLPQSLPRLYGMEGVEEVMSKIHVTVKLFAAYQEAYGVPELQLELPEGTSVAAVRDRLIADHPQLRQWRDLTRFGVNLQFVDPTTCLHNGDEVVLIPPVSGGTFASSLLD